MDPHLSIIMTVYNREALIGATIASIRAQTYPAWELLVMDDGSDDGTASVVKAIVNQDARIRYFPFKHSGITGRLKNAGIALAQGEMVCFMDSDDLWMPGKLEIQLSALEQHPEAGFSFTNGYNFSDTSGEVETWGYARRIGHDCGNFFEASCSGAIGIRITTLMVRKSLLSGENLFREDRMFTDFSFITNLARKHPAVIVYDELIQYRKHESNATSTGWIADYEDHMETVMRYFSEGWLTRSLSRSILYKLQMSLGQTYLAHGLHREGRKAFLAAWKLKPGSIVALKKIVRSFFMLRKRGAIFHKSRL